MPMFSENHVLRTNLLVHCTTREKKTLLVFWHVLKIMATVHPSRMGLVPQDPKQAHITSYHRRSISPRRDRSSLSNHSREGGRNADKDKDDYRGSHRDRPRPDNTRGRDRSGDNIRDGRYDSDRQRASPQYDDYRRPLPLVEGRTTWSQSENMYPDRRGDIMRDRSHGGSGADFMERFVMKNVAWFTKLIVTVTAADYREKVR